MRYYWYISLPFNCSIIKGQAYWKIRSATPLQTFFIFFPSIEWTDHPSCAPSLTFAGPRLRLSRCSSWWWRYPEAWVQSDPICSKLPETSSSEPYTVNYHVAWIQNHKPSSRILYIVDYIYIHYIYIYHPNRFLTPGRWPCRPSDLDLFSPGSHHSSWEAIWDGGNHHLATWWMLFTVNLARSW